MSNTFLSFYTLLFFLSIWVIPSIDFCFPFVALVRFLSRGLVNVHVSDPLAMKRRTHSPTTLPFKHMDGASLCRHVPRGHSSQASQSSLSGSSEGFEYVIGPEYIFFSESYSWMIIFPARFWSITLPFVVLFLHMLRFITLIRNIICKGVCYRPIFSLFKLFIASEHTVNSLGDMLSLCLFYLNYSGTSIPFTAKHPSHSFPHNRLPSHNTHTRLYFLSYIYIRFPKFDSL